MRLSLLSFLATAALGAALPPPAGSVTVSNLSYSGTGCPQGTAKYYISADRNTLVLIFEGFTVDYRLKETSKACHLSVDFTQPTRYQFSVSSTDYQGWAVIDKGYRAGLQTTYSFPGQDKTVSPSLTFIPFVSGT